MRAIASVSRIAGRLLIHFSLEPVSWRRGLAALCFYKVLENMEIGHNVMHGQYNFMRDPQLSSHCEWDMVGTAKTWKRPHNATCSSTSRTPSTIKRCNTSIPERVPRMVSDAIARF